MKAVSYTAFGAAPDVLTLTTDFPTPTLPAAAAPASSDPPPPPTVLLRVHAVALNPVDWKRISGSLRPFFPAPSLAAPLVPCMDVAGVVTATSSTTPAFPVGTRVFGCIPGGAMAEVAAAPEAVLAAIPEGVSFVDAAAVPLACLTVLQCLRRLEEQVGEGGGDGGGNGASGDATPPPAIPSLLVTSGAGGTGSFALQLAKRVFHIPRVVTTVSAAKADVATGLGADECIDYKTTTVGAALGGDAATRVAAGLDLVGDVPGVLAGVAPGGAVVAIAGPFQPGQMGPWCPGGVPLWLRLALWAMCVPANVAAARSRVRWSSLLLTSRGAELAEVAAWMREGKVKALVDSVHEGLEAYADAFGVLMGGHAAGKVVVRVVPEEA